MDKKETWIQKLTALQVELGYKFNQGVIDNVAVLGFAGEAGEVIAELEPKRKYIEDGAIRIADRLLDFSLIARDIDNYKKAIKAGHMGSVTITAENHGNLIKELADHFFYYNAICNNLGIGFETLAEIVFKKALANYKANPERSDNR